MAQLITLVRDVFASVRFAILVFSLLAATSVIGTVIPQGEQVAFYLERYGEQFALLIKILDLDVAYSSFWFRFLFLLLTLSLVVCTLDRLPRVLRLMRGGEATTDPEKLLRGKNTTVLTSDSANQQSAEAEVRRLLGKAGWRMQAKPTEHGSLLIAEKGAWTRLGPSIVHASVLLILLGAQIGALLGFKAYVQVPEGKSTDVVYRRDDQRPIPLSFNLRCNAFAMDLYDNGMPKEYRSDLVILENNVEKARKKITVNDPLRYGGITFYQSSYEPIPGQFIVEIAKKSQTEKPDLPDPPLWKFHLAQKEKKILDEAGLTFEILDTGPDGHGHGPYTVRFDDGAGDPVEIMTEDSKPASLARLNATYTVTVKRRFATGLQVVKDPGVWLVYAGFGMMLIGLYISFFMSHRRVSIMIQGMDSITTVAVGGHSNKNRDRFADTLAGVVADLLKEQSLGLRRS